MKTISAEDLRKFNQADPVDLIDVRTPIEFREVHVEFAKNIPLDRLDPIQIMGSREKGDERPVYLICRSGSRGQMACEKFYQAGFDNVFNVDGGTNACITADMPITRGRKAVSLERQVRIAAGILIVTGVVLGYSVNAWLFLLSGFVGAGLVFAGVTDTCAMGMLIAKMPWNQVGDCESDCDAQNQRKSSPEKVKSFPPMRDNTCSG